MERQANSAQPDNTSSLTNSNATVSDRSSVSGVAANTQAVLVVVYATTALLSILGNLLVIVVFVIGRQPRTSLRRYLASLAVSDLIMAIFCMPFTFSYTMLNHWVFGPFVCTVVLYMQAVAVTASVGTSTAVAVDRYLAVAHPLRRARLRSWTAVAAVWAIAGSVSVPQLVVGRIGNYLSPEGVEVTECTEEWPEPKQELRRAYTFFVLAATFLLPLGVTAFAYSFIGRDLWKRKVPGNPNEQRDNLQLKSKRKVIKMLVIVVTLFGLCWFPLHLFTIIVDFNPQLSSEGQSQTSDLISTVFITVHWLAMSNSFVNPIIYSFLNDSFRSDLRWLFWRLNRCCRRQGQDDFFSDQTLYLDCPMTSRQPSPNQQTTLAPPPGNRHLAIRHPSPYRQTNIATCGAKAVTHG